MGKLLALSLVCTLAAAVLFQPILMGKPRDAVDESEKQDGAEDVKRFAPKPAGRNVHS
jgi:hypothetical protein